jgi:hypothetical protein
MAESRRIKEYRKSLQDMAKPQPEERRKVLEGKAAKLGAEIYGGERKGKPKIEPGDKPRR